MTWLLTILGILCILVAARDVLNTLFNPAGKLHLTHYLMLGVWHAFRPLASRQSAFQPITGFAALFTVVGTWMLLMVLGWALIYLPHMPGDFLLSFDYDQPGTNRLIVSIYLSMVTLVTLGFGDIVPTASGLRLITPLEGFVGFGLVTAGISWFLSINPVLSRRRILAYQITLLHEDATRYDGEGIVFDVSTREQLFQQLTSQVINVNRDLVQFPVTYYFHDTDPRASISTALPFLLQLARSEQSTDDGSSVSARTQAAMLEQAINDYLDTIAISFLGMAGRPPDTVLQAYMHEH